MVLRHQILRRSMAVEKIGIELDAKLHRRAGRVKESDHAYSPRWMSNSQS
jgi:hypothetical protein